MFKSDHYSRNNGSFSKKIIAFLIFQWDLQMCQILLKYKILGVTHLVIWHGMTHAHPSQEGLWWTEGSCSGEASLPGLLIKHKHAIHESISEA